MLLHVIFLKFLRYTGINKNHKTMEYYVTEIKLNDKEREVEVKLNNGGVVKICECCESWEQYNSTKDEKATTVDIADHFNEWLHGGDEPDEFETRRLVAETAKRWLKENLYDVFSDIPHFSERLDDALETISKDRCGMEHADQWLYSKMSEKLADWCDDNDIDSDYITIDEIIF